MAYVVREAPDLPQLPSAKLIDRVCYPYRPTEIENEVTSDIDLWEVEHNVEGFFSLSFWKSFFYSQKYYNIIVHQKDPINGRTSTFVLYEGSSVESSKDAFEKICATINPLVVDCTLLLTKKLLEKIVSPSPIEPSNLSHHLIKVMHSDPDTHPHWARVLQALAVYTIGKDDVNAVTELLDSGVELFTSNRKGNTLLHLARSGRSVKQIINRAKITKKEEPKRLLNQTNKEGKTALHEALQKGNQEVISELIQAGADFSTITDDEYGSNAFHVAAESGNCKFVCFDNDRFLQRENAEKQQFFNTLNAFNKKCLTPLMVCAQNNFVDSAVYFLQAGANPNIQNFEFGNTALHFAAEKCYATLVKSLIAFGADIGITNKDGKTALNVTSGECAEILDTTACKMKQAYSCYSKTKREVTVEPDSIFLLSMDGGGVKGLFLTQTLMAIQKRMKELQPDCELIHKYFDYIAGTSSGGLVTLSLVCANASLEATRSQFFKAGDELFSQPVTYPLELVTHFACQTYGKDSLITDVGTPRVIIPSVLANTSPPVLHLMCNYGEARNGLRPPNEWKVWEVSRATSAAPFYFPPFEDKLIDGGVMANNPTLDAITEIFEQTEKEGKEAKIGLVVSVGTGITPPTETEDVGIFVPNINNAFNAIRHLGDTLSATVNTFHLLVSQATNSDGQSVKRAREWCKSIGASYYRLSVPLEKPIGLAETNKAALADVMYQCTLYLYDSAAEVDAIARLLLSRQPM